MSTVRRTFSDRELEKLREIGVVGVRSGTKHRFTAVWAVVIGRRVFARSWSDKPTGWYRAFREQPSGALSIGTKKLRVRAVQTRSERLRRAVSKAYGEKYDTKGSQRWVEGFAEKERVEFAHAIRTCGCAFRSRG